MKKILISLLVIFTSCAYQRAAKSNSQKTESNISEFYSVYKIDSINSYYLIYAKKDKIFCKIVSKKETMPNCRNVKYGLKYKFLLSSIWKRDIIINGVNVSPSALPSVTCLSFDDSTQICLEKGLIKDLFQADNLKGLCFIGE